MVAVEVASSGAVTLTQPAIGRNNASGVRLVEARGRDAATGGEIELRRAGRGIPFVPVFLRLAAAGALGRRICGVAGLIALSVAALPAAVFQAGPWKVDVSVTPDQPTITLGEPTWLSFTVRNLMEEPLQLLVGGDYHNELGRPASFVVRARGKDGKWVEVPDATGTGGLVGAKDLPARGSYVFRLFVPHWAAFHEAGTYVFDCRRALQLLRPVPGGVFAKQPTHDVPVAVETTLTVMPRDEAALKRRIAELGEQVVAAGGEKAGDEATIGLSWIEHPAVVPYFNRMFAMRSYAMKYIALQKIARFATDEALAGLRAAVTTKASDFDHVEIEQATELAARIRAAAVGALGRCRHPRAADVLLAQRKDQAESVRLAVLRAGARLPTPQALALVDEFAQDGSPEVRDAARRYAAVLREAAPGAAGR